MAFKLYEKELEKLKVELSMSERHATLEFREHVGVNEAEPYRVFVGRILNKINNSFTRVVAALDKKPIPHVPHYSSKAELMKDVRMCYDSLVNTGNSSIADGRLRDLIRRVSCFGITLTPLDIRQDSAKHLEAIDTVTRYIGIGSYKEWSEKQKQEWLINELKGDRCSRPLIPRYFLDSEKCTPSVKDTLTTFSVAAEIGPESLGAYIISMARAPSDVLAVMLLQREMGVKHPMRVVPLFETLDDLENSSETMQALFSMPWYLKRIKGFQEVMVGYSDSGKDAGR
jgi:phosphoenolpyruvate carboxylase